MFKFAYSLASKLRLAENNIQPVGRKLSWIRNYVAKTSQCTKYKEVLAEAIFNEGRKALAAGVNSKDLKEGIGMAVEAVSTNLSTRTRMISTYEEVAQVAIASANGHKEIGVLIAQAMETIGTADRILISDGTTMDIELQFLLGGKFDVGYISPCFATNRKKRICVLDNALVFIHENKLSDLDVLMDVMRMAVRHPILLVAEDFENEVLAALIKKKFSSGTKLCAIRAPEFGPEERKNSFFQAIACIANGTVVTEQDCIRFRHHTRTEDIDEMPPLELMLGRCLKVIVSENDTLILRRHFDTKEIERQRSTQLTSSLIPFGSIAKEDFLFAALKVGGASKVDVAEKKNVATLALKAVKAATTGGVVPGDGVALLYASKELDKLQTTNSGQKIGVQIIQNALKMPVHTIASDAGIEGSAVVGKLLEQENSDLGYDAATGEYVDMIKSGTVEPLEVVITAFVGATSSFFKKLRCGKLD